MTEETEETGEKRTNKRLHDPMSTIRKIEKLIDEVDPPQMRHWVTDYIVTKYATKAAE